MTAARRTQCCRRHVCIRHFRLAVLTTARVLAVPPFAATTNGRASRQMTSSTAAAFTATVSTTAPPRNRRRRRPRRRPRRRRPLAAALAAAALAAAALAALANCCTPGRRLLGRLQPAAGRVHERLQRPWRRVLPPGLGGLADCLRQRRPWLPQHSLLHRAGSSPPPSSVGCPPMPGGICLPGRTLQPTHCGVWQDSSGGEQPTNGRNEAAMTAAGYTCTATCAQIDQGHRTSADPNGGDQCSGVYGHYNTNTNCCSGVANVPPPSFLPLPPPPPLPISLHSIFNGGNLATNGALAEWRALSGYGYQQHCNRQGFNIQGQPANGGVSGQGNARIGMYFNEQHDCDSPDSGLLLWAERPPPPWPDAVQAALAARAIITTPAVPQGPMYGCASRC